MSDVARVAGVSYATADRVINDRGNVAEKSVRKVHDAMSELGYIRNVAAANLSRQRTYRLAFLLPKGRNAFFSRVRAHLDSLVEHLVVDQISVDVSEIDAFDVEGLKHSLLSIVDASYDGIAVVGLQSEEIAEPLRKLQEQGTSIIGLVSDLPVDHRAAYVGINNVAAGRTAGRLLGLSHAGRKGCVQMIVGSLDARDHADRLSGFREVISEDYPNIELLDPIMTRDDAEKVAAVVKEALVAEPKVSAVYNVGAGNSGLVAALEQCTRPKRFFCIVHELVAHTHKALLNKHIDLVIDQRPDVEINRSITILKALIDGREIPPMQDLVPTIYVRDNLPSHIPDTTLRHTQDHD
ncbi:LacI family DNA-binding transcriptional regulator [Granulosicoccus antarcticus]|uniref:LacI family DNA-binding transcriptional regulator n=1 Tax=Granulosicoccus antarcticus TaxID=437505 RepID=UPI00197AAB48|nr:LacI family DNA-binding transcriptional regulator [Granulosicoccus antarcticus]